MLDLFRSAAILIFAASLSSPHTFPQQFATQGTASISGQVTVGAKPASGVIVLLSQEKSDDSLSSEARMRGQNVQRTATDDEGRYRFDGLPAGRYEVNTHAPSLVAGGNNTHSVALADGGTVENMDFSLTKGGVITGRVTTSDGRPVIMEPVQVKRSDGAGQRGGMGMQSFTTDDRGIYRVYGLPPGRYTVSVGRNGGFSVPGTYLKTTKRLQTYYPGVTDESRATLVELPLGGEVANLDIKLGSPIQTYRVLGRVVDAESGKPVPNAIVTYHSSKPDLSTLERSGIGSPTTSTGEFRLEGLAPGSYLAAAMFGLLGESTEFYSDIAPFELGREDISGVQIKVHRGAVVTGVLNLEGASDPSIMEKLKQVTLVGVVVGSDQTVPTFARAQIGADGSFQMRGVGPGKMRIMIQDIQRAGEFGIRTVERNGVPQIAGIDIAVGEQISDVRVVLAFASGVIRGQVSVTGGALSKDAHLSVVAVRKADDGAPIYSNSQSRDADVDTSRNFVIDRLLPGNYLVTVTAVLNPNAPVRLRQVRQVREEVIVTADVAADVTLVLDLNAKER